MVRRLGSDLISGLLCRIMPRLAGDAGFFIRLAAQTIHRNHILMVSPGLCRSGVKFPGMHILEDMDQAIAAAEAILGRGPQRVVVFPAGGVTYPVPAPDAGIAGN